MRRRRSPGVASWGARIVLAAALILPGALVGGVAAAAGGQVRLVRQTPWVVPGGTLTLSLRAADVLEPTSVELAVTLYPAVRSRSELARTSLGEGLRAPVWPRTNTAVPLPEVPAAVDGTITVQVPTRGPKAPPDPSRATLSQPGIYPVQVELRQLGGGDTLHRLTTHLLAVDAGEDGARLATTVVLPLSAPPSSGLEDGPVRPPAGTTALVDAAAGLAASARVPLTLAPTPEVLSSLATSSPAAAASLQDALADRDVLGRPYVPVEVPALGRAASALLPQHLEAGREAVRAALGRDPIRGTWLADESLDGAALAQVVAAGSSRLVLPQAALGPTGAEVPVPLRPVTVTGGGSTATALVADGALAAHLDPAAPAVEQPLIAHRLLADLAAIATLPADQGAPPRDPLVDRGVAAVVAPRRFTPSSGFLSELLAGLASSPVLRPVDLADAFAVAPEPPPPAPRPATTTRRARRGTTTTLPAPAGRTLLPLRPDAAARDISGVATDAVLQVSSHTQVLPDPTPIEPPAPGVSRPSQPTQPTQASQPGQPGQPGSQAGAAGAEELRRRLLVATSADLPIDRRRARLRALVDRAQGDLTGIRMPVDRSLRLTARTGQLPVGIFNETGRTARVLLHLESDKLEFPEGNRSQVVLDHRTTTTRMLVRVRASGSFPVKVRLLTPDGTQVLEETDYVVRAHTFPGVAIAVSGAAALFLAVWWARTLLAERGRHARPRGSPAPALGSGPLAPAVEPTRDHRPRRRRHPGRHRARRRHRRAG